MKYDRDFRERQEAQGKGVAVEWVQIDRKLN